MLTAPVIVIASFAYVGLLFAIAYYGDKRADEGRSIIANPYIYALSLAVYCTSWTFYGSVGRAATSGIGFLPIFIGPTLMAMLWWYVMLKMIRISKANRITSIADFIASRYGKSQLLGGLVTITCAQVVLEGPVAQASGRPLRAERGDGVLGGLALEHQCPGGDEA